MTFTQIIYEYENHVAKITLNNPEALNALSDVMVQELKDAVDVVNGTRDVSVVVITGAGKAFSAGGNIKAMQDRIESGMTYHERQEVMRRRVGDAVRKIRSIRQPVIAAVNGASAGAGCALVLLCDIRVASEKAKFSLPFAKLGLSLDWGSAYTLPRLVGTARAIEFVSTCRLIDSKSALEMGLVNRVVPHDSLMEEVDRLCAEISKNAPFAVALSKASIRKGSESSLDLILEDEAYIQAMCQLSEDHQEGVIAFLEKRGPVFKGK
jgi:2-(1,2-epoxy-1,2-dihydrophenyl)acetyl-CoA isomerase